MGFSNLDPTPPYMKKPWVSRIVESLMAFYFGVGGFTLSLWVIHTIIRVFSLGGDWLDKVIFVVKGILFGALCMIGWAYMLYNDFERFWWMGYVAFYAAVVWLHDATQGTVFEKLFEVLLNIVIVLGFVFVIVYFKQI